MATPIERDRTSLRIAKPLKEKLERLSKATRRTQTELVEEALEAYCELQVWQLASVQEGIQAAEAGKVYTTAQVLSHLEQLKGVPNEMD